MGEVYLVVHRELGRRFVAKLMRPELAEDSNFVARLRLEARILGKLAHSNIVTVAGFGKSADGRLFIVMECLKGRTLGEELYERLSLPVVEAIDVVLQMLAGLGAAHAAGVVHRDIKPDNVFLHEPPVGPRVVKLLDFGVARVVPGISPTGPLPLAVPTDTGAVIGTPEFISPEGARGLRVDHRADLYSTALCLYVLIAGHGPFHDVESNEHMLAAQAVEDAPPLSRFVPGVSAALDRLLIKALQKDPGRRYQSAGELAAGLEEVRVGLVEALRDAMAHQSTELIATAAVRTAEISVAAQPPVAKVDKGGGTELLLPRPEPPASPAAPAAKPAISGAPRAHAPSETPRVDRRPATATARTGDPVRVSSLIVFLVVAILAALLGLASTLAVRALFGP
jgi:serine/threonine-protein kinase